MLTIRLATDNDFDAIWEIFHPIVQAGETYPYAPETSKEEAFQIWIKAPAATYIALDNEECVGTYMLKPNQPGLGSHVCNAGYMVKVGTRGRGIGRAMCLHSQQEARRLGFLAMQFNLVVSTNQAAVKLWQALGFNIVGTLPRAYNHHKFGLVDAHVMYKLLEGSPQV